MMALSIAVSLLFGGAPATNPSPGLEREGELSRRSVASDCFHLSGRRLSARGQLLSERALIGAIVCDEDRVLICWAEPTQPAERTRVRCADRVQSWTLAEGLALRPLRFQGGELIVAGDRKGRLAQWSLPVSERIK